ncbi:MAG: FAD-dependent oxidoreductase [Anaerolineae bacterium]
MSVPGTVANPLRVAIIGAGPTGFYAADYLLKQKELSVEIDLFDKLPVPFGLVRFGVAPDHQKIKSVTRAYERTARRPNVRFFGNVKFGEHLTLQDVSRHYHQVIFTTGAQSDRRLGIPGEDLPGSHAATEFVAWYNGHPEYRNCHFDLSHERVAVIGVGNVAMDVARILCRTPAELRRTDMADYAIEALSRSRVKEVYIIGRRGPAQAKFTNPEIAELGQLEDADIYVPSADAELDPLSRAELEAGGDRATMKNVETVQSFTTLPASGKSRRLVLRFLVSPAEIIGDEQAGIRALRLVKNELVPTASGGLRPRATDRFEDLPVGLVFRSVGYRGVPLPGIPFFDDWGVILNERGRILDSDSRQPLPGMYTAGWIKRGPSGVIGTNKPDAVETVGCMLEDAAAGGTFAPAQPQVEAVTRLLAERQPHLFTFDDWLKLDALEQAAGEAQGRPRVKFTSVAEMLAALGR